MKISNFLLAVFLFILVIIIYKFLFLPIPINGGDYTPTSFVVQILNGNFFGWCGYRDLGFNCIAINLHYSWFWIIIRSISSLFHLPTFLSERIFWWMPFFLSSFLSVTLLVKKIFPKTKFWIFAPLVYVFNTYVLMLLGGGQVSGIGLGYGFTPFVLLAWIYLLERQSFFWSVVWSSTLAVLVALDPRMGFIGCSVCIVYAIVSFVYFRAFSSLSLQKILKTTFFLLIVPLIVIAGLQFYWLQPTIVYKQNPLHELGPAYDTIGAVKFFSFATYENALSLLHPNWPENIFGLTHFMRPEFLILPLLAFCSLLFIKKGKQESFFVIFFLLLALLGAFLAKGANNPFGSIYLWMFEKVPGFSLFRDSTKWYLLVALSYAILIPYTLEKIYRELRDNHKFSIFNFQFSIKSKLFNFQNMLPILIIAYIFFLIKPAFLNQLSGTFQSHVVPNEYTQYQAFLSKDPSFFRTLWVPTSSRYGQFDTNHPTIDAGNLLNASESSILADFQKSGFEKIIEEASVKYVVVPDDVHEEIFITDRKYDDTLYKNAVAVLAKVSWLKKENSFGRIALFSVANPQPHFWLEKSKETVSIVQKDPDTYILLLKNVQRGQKLLFSESFNKGWVAVVGSKKVTTQQYDNYFNSFVLAKSGSYTMVVRFAPQDLVEKGLWVSSISLFLILGYFAFKLLNWYNRGQFIK